MGDILPYGPEGRRGPPVVRPGQPLSYAAGHPLPYVPGHALSYVPGHTAGHPLAYLARKVPEQALIRAGKGGEGRRTRRTRVVRVRGATALVSAPTGARAGVRG
ncbi:hypothetical protein [Streptomyces thermolilacinus]|uniref:hypothetical protein n=1 Tax=Streptomyces thermolilacinus TaxID=285540 RepID=UPI0033FC6133